MRSQASGWAAGIAASKCSSRMLRGLATMKAASPEALEASRRGTGGVDDCGTAEEDGPVTWETPDRPVGGSGRRRTGDPLRRAVGGKRSDGRLVAVTPPGTEPTLARLVRHDRGQTEGVPMRHGESDGCIRAMMVGNGLGTRTQRSKGGQC